jgi:hypothetical protein
MDKKQKQAGLFKKAGRLPNPWAASGFGSLLAEGG